MRLEANSLRLPSRILTNADVLSLICEHSRETMAGDLARAIRKIERMLSHSGARERRWLDDGDQPLGLIKECVRSALSQADVRTSDVDLLIYSGIDRGFLEPANAYFIADALGMDRVHCFDVLDGCNGWLRAAQIVQNAFCAGQSERALIINAEFPMVNEGAIFPASFQLHSDEQLRWCYAAYTLGEGASATLMARDDARPWTFRFSSRPRRADLCSIPIHGFERYSEPSERLARNGSWHFSAFSSEMFADAPAELTALIGQLDTPLDAVRLVVPHAASQRAWDVGAEPLGLRDRLHHVFPKYGNLATVSIPAGLYSAAQEGKLQRDDLVLVCGASAGMSYGVLTFVY